MSGTPMSGTPSHAGDPAMELFAEFRFEAAHRLPHVEPSHMCARMHGHSYTARLTIAGRVDPYAGWVMDYGRIVASFEPVRLELDHHCLNDIIGLENPTSEHLAMWLWNRLLPTIPSLRAVEVREMLNIGCVYRGPHSIV
jgi:6-pyruvoyltetrahydropterin/6-carboxytetrahydropterin synthase